MKKFFVWMAVAAMSVQSASAQKAIAESKTFDNWYIGIQGGASVKTTHTSIFQNLNPHAGLRIGRYFTPVFGFAIEGSAYVRDRKFEHCTTFVKCVDSHLLATVNLSNWIGGYKGEPRRLELVVVAGPGWNHYFGLDPKWPNNDLTAKGGLDLNLNLGKTRAWQLFLEPAILYNLDRYGKHQRPKFDVHHSALQLMAGLNYKFGNSNGTHNFVLGTLRSQAEIDQLNARINELRAVNDAKEKQIATDAQTIATLRTDLEAAKNVKPTVVQQVVKTVVNNNVLQPTVIFGLGKSTVDAAQMASVAMVAKYMKNHPEARLEIKGYASPEGDPVLNQKLSEKRAQSVKDVLVSRYGVSADRLIVKGMGATDELFDEVDFNRVATFTDLSK